VILAGYSCAFAHDPVTTKLTWSGEISRIVYKRCTGCHRDGGKTPVTLFDYEVVRPWAKAIRDEVLARRMPPWGAVKGFGEFQGDLSLTQDEINRIAEWVEGGAPEGDPRYLPVRPLSVPERPLVQKGHRVRGPGRLPGAASVIAIAPSGDVPAAKITARLPDGTIKPLLWLLGYRDKWRRTYVYRKPVALPAGTVVEANPDVRFEMVLASKSQRRVH
jgi:hypothetical protein